MTTLNIENVSKKYGKLETVNGVNLSLKAGERPKFLSGKKSNDNFEY